MTTLRVQFNKRGQFLELVTVPGVYSRLTLIEPDGTTAFYRRYEYWEALRANAEFEALVGFAEPGLYKEARDEEAVSGDAEGAAVGGADGSDATGRVLRPRKQRSRSKRASAQVGAVSVPAGNAHGG